MQSFRRSVHGAPFAEPTAPLPRVPEMGTPLESASIARSSVTSFPWVGRPTALRWGRSVSGREVVASAGLAFALRLTALFLWAAASSLSMHACSSQMSAPRAGPMSGLAAGASGVGLDAFWPWWRQQVETAFVISRGVMILTCASCFRPPLLLCRKAPSSKSGSSGSAEIVAATTAPAPELAPSLAAERAQVCYAPAGSSLGGLGTSV